jgi:predicted unusual protein kinase regulating ubiquinone biosynthesis (AarF/ABC1/UbiB family)
VVLKIQKPGVQKVLLTDLNFLYASARILEFLKPSLSWASLSAIVEEIQKTMMEECDFLKEAANLNTFRQFLATTGNDRVVVPRVYDQATTLRVLTMERLYGVPFTDLDSLRRVTKDPENTLIAAMNTWFSSLLFCEFFHADVHAGNLMVLDDGRIGFIDFGIVGRIAPDTWSAMATLLDAIPAADYGRIAEAMMRIGITKEQVDVAALSRDLEALFERVDTLGAEEALRNPGGDNPINRFLLDMVAVGERHGLHFPREFALLLKQFLYFDRYVQLLAPDLDIYGDGRLHIMPEGA